MRSDAAADAPATTSKRRFGDRRRAAWLSPLVRAHEPWVANKQQLARLVETFAPGLQDVLGVDPVSGGQLVASWSHHGRCRHKAAFAALAGVSPVPASSGRTHRHRLNRGGDRQLNRALHDILLTRWRMCPRTHAYISASRARGKSDPQIRRCLERYIARELFRVLNACAAH
ncbi:transposase [Rhodococcus ruber]|uniref:transposase n=1 Tax=Rhodococcus ruber TaxID=1830 RepID=UPI003CCAC1CB